MALQHLGDTWCSPVGDTYTQLSVLCCVIGSANSGIVPVVLGSVFAMKFHLMCPRDNIVKQTAEHGLFKQHNAHILMINDLLE